MLKFYELHKYNFFCIYIKRSKIFSTKCYQKHKQRLQKKLVKDINIFLKKKKKISDNIVVNITNISQRMKNRTLLNIEKNIIE